MLFDDLEIDMQVKREKYLEKTEKEYKNGI
jgi:hypothetical protein